MTRRRSKQGYLADRWARLEQALARMVAWDSNEPGLFWQSDLLEGTVAVAALLLMVAIGVSLWLTIPLAILTYVGVALLRPALKHQQATVSGSDPGQLASEALGDGRGHQKHAAEATLADASGMAAHFGLTPREREILPLLAQRLTDREIAERLCISHRTAMNHAANILGKLGLASRRDVAPFIAQHGLQPPSRPPNGPE